MWPRLVPGGSMLKDLVSPPDYPRPPALTLMEYAVDPNEVHRLATAVTTELRQASPFPA